MNVLSLFDGMSCGQIALNRLGIKYDKYFASEIDKYAIKVTQHNFPNTIQLGDVSNINGSDLPNIDLLIGGSPCQSFSNAGDMTGFNGKSGLFYEYVRLLKEINPKYFLLENVKMKKEWQDIISKELGVEPIMINSSLVSAQNRKRLYWTNIPNIEQPIDKKIGWGSIREFNVANNFYYSEKGLKWLNKQIDEKNKKLSIWKSDEKCQMIEASHAHGYSSQRFFAIEDTNGLRYITPLECERAQTIPDNYTNIVSNSQRYKMIGNGWTVDVISHIFKNLI
jgi:DNA-cytosine methyltransferase